MDLYSPFSGVISVEHTAMEHPVSENSLQSDIESILADYEYNPDFFDNIPSPTYSFISESSEYSTFPKKQ